MATLQQADYFKGADESIDQYNSRISLMSGGQTPTGLSELSSGAPPIAPEPKQADPLAFSNVISQMRNTLGKNQDLIDRKNKIFTALYDRPLNDEEKSTLTPSLQRAMEANDRGLIDMEIRMINDELKGRKESLDTSVKFLSEGYQASLKSLEDERNKAISTFTTLTGSLGSTGEAYRVLEGLYGADTAKKLLGEIPDVQTRLDEKDEGALKSADWDTARGIIADNPDLTPLELETKIREKTKLTDGDIKSLLGAQKFLTADYLKTAFTKEVLEKAAKAAGYKRGFVDSLWAGSGAVFTDKYIEEQLIPTIESYRKSGYSDDDILAAIKKKLEE